MGAVHQLVHHNHSGKQECGVNENPHDPHTTHLHDERYANEQCSLCAFVLSTPEIPVVKYLFYTRGVSPGTLDTFRCTPSSTRTIDRTNSLRGPPPAC
jgi:hypothetical protein